LPQQIEQADESELRKYLPFFLEETLRKFAEGEAERVGAVRPERDDPLAVARPADDANEELLAARMRV